MRVSLWKRGGSPNISHGQWQHIKCCALAHNYWIMKGTNFNKALCQKAVKEATPLQHHCTPDVCWPAAGVGKQLLPGGVPFAEDNLCIGGLQFSPENKEDGFPNHCWGWSEEDVVDAFLLGV